MMLLDAFLRYATVGLLSLLLVMTLPSAWHDHRARYLVGVIVSVAALLLGTSHPELQLPTTLHIIVRLIDPVSIVFIWWFGRSLFQDDFKLGALDGAIFILVVASVLSFRLSEFGWLNPPLPGLEYFVSAVSLALMGHLSYATWKGRNEDLIESRRRGRFYFMIGLAAVAFLIVLSERLISSQYAIELSLLRVAFILPMTLWAALWLLEFRPQKLSFESLAKTGAQTPKIDSRDKPLLQQLNVHMEEHCVYRKPNLTIRTLAQTLNTSEHRLRALINQGLGYRNFSEYLNHFRIEEIKQSMLEPENLRTPILSLALNTGFSSLAPFNRAFKSQTGQTPSDYRSKHLQDQTD